MSSCLWRVVGGMVLFGFVTTLEVPAAVAKEPTRRALMSANDAVDGAHSEASKCHRVVA